MSAAHLPVITVIPAKRQITATQTPLYITVEAMTAQESDKR